MYCKSSDWKKYRSYYSDVKNCSVSLTAYDTNSEEKTQDNSSGQQKLEYEILDETFPKYDLTFKIIVIGNSGKKI